MLVGGCYRFTAMMTTKQCHDKPELMAIGLFAVRHFHSEEVKGLILPTSIRSILPTGLAIPSFINGEAANESFPGRSDHGAAVL